MLEVSLISPELQLQAHLNECLFKNAISMMSISAVWGDLDVSVEPLKPIWNVGRFCLCFAFP